MDTEPVQVFIKNEQGQIWGPLTPGTVELLLENGIVKGRVMVSMDGEKYAMPGRFPDIRDCFPRELWGVDVPPGETPPPAPPTPAPAHPASAAVPKAGPGASGGFTAGPGARAAAQGRQQAPRAAPPVMTPGPPSVPPPAPVAAKKPAPAPPPTQAPEGEGAELPPSSGDLAEISAVKLYSLAAGAEMTALLTFELPDREIQLHLRKGNPEFVDSTHPEDGLATFLVKVNMASPEQIAQAVEQKDRFGGELLSALFGTGILNPGTAFAQLIERAKGLLSRAFLASSGSFTVEPKELPPQRSMPLGQKWAVLSELVRRMPSSEVKRRLQGEWDLPAMKSGGRVPSSDLRLTPQETRALGYVDGVRSLAQFQKDMPQEYETVLRVVFLLGELDGISFAAVPSRPAPMPEAPPPAAPKITAASGSGLKAAPRPPPERSPTSPRPAARAPGSTSSPKLTPPAAPPAPPAAETIEDLRALAAKLKGQNHFEVLGLNEKADAGQAKAAYFRLAKSYHPDTIPEGAPAEVRQLKAEIFGRVGDAYRTLSDEKLRADYVDELKHGGKGEKVDISQILLAEEQFQKGCILVKARKWPDAVRMLDDAIKNNPEEPETYAWRGYARFFANPDRKEGSVEAQKDLALALKKNDRIASAHYFVGHIAKVNGDERLALKEFKRAVELNPDHIDAAREVRMMSGKK